MKGLGLLPSTPERVAHRFRLGGPFSRLATAAKPRGAAQLVECQTLEQGQTSTCHAHSLAAAVWVAKNAAGKPLPWIPSPLAIASMTYADTRAKGAISGSLLPALADNGAQLQDDADAASMWGIAPMGPHESGRFSDVPSLALSDPFPEPDFATVQIAGEDIVSGEYAIPVDTDAPNICAAMLDAGIPIWVGFYVDITFERLGKNDVAPAPDMADTNGGGHAVHLTGYRTRIDGQFEWRLKNSWGDWCLNGGVWCSPEWLAATWSLFPMTVT